MAKRFVGYVVSNDPNKYPDGGNVGDFYYKKHDGAGLYIWKRHNVVNLISFRIQRPTSTSGKNYTAEKGMTWEQFVASDYNSRNEFVTYTDVDLVLYNGDKLYNENTLEHETRPTDEIINGTTYWYTAGGGGGAN